MRSPEDWAEILRKQLEALKTEFDRRSDKKQLWLQIVAETFQEAMAEARHGEGTEAPFTP